MHSSSDENKSNNISSKLLTTVSLILKILVLVNANQSDADDCNIGYMYEYVKHSLIATAVIMALLLLIGWCGGISILSDAEGCLKISLVLMFSSIFGAIIAIIVLLGKIWHSNPNETILFYDAFWKTPVNCPSTIDSKWYDWAQVPVKYDAFTMMFMFLIIGIATCCLGTGGIVSFCANNKNNKNNKNNTNNNQLGEIDIYAQA